MERIEALINKLKEQHALNADPALLLGTVQLLQFELTKLNGNDTQSLGTSKVAVVLPSMNVMAAPASSYEKYAPKPAEKTVQEIPEVQEIKETVLVDNGTLSVVQRNG